MELLAIPLSHQKTVAKRLVIAIWLSWQTTPTKSLVIRLVILRRKAAQNPHVLKNTLRLLRVVRQRQATHPCLTHFAVFLLVALATH